MDKQTCLLGLRVTLGLFCALMNGIDMSFNVYAVPMKETFNFTQTQVEIVASMSCAGFGLAFIEILLRSTFGYISTFVVSWITLPLTSGLFGLAAVHSEFIHSRPWWVYVLQLFMSLSNSITLTTMRNVVVRILPKRFLGSTIGLFGAALCLGKIAYSGLLEGICHNDLSRFFITTSTVSGVYLSLYYPLLYPAARSLEIREDTKSQEESRRDKGSEEKNHSEAESPDDNHRDEKSQEDEHRGAESQKDNQQSTESQERSCLLGHTEENISPVHIFKSRFFHMTFWTCVVFTSSAYTVLNNITSMTNSIGVKDSFNIVTTMSLCIMTTRVVYGLLFDKAASQAVAFWLLFSMYFTFLLGLTLGLWFLNPITVYIIAALCGIALGPAYELPVSMLVLEYGRSNLNLIFVALYFTVATSQLLMQITTGYLYDSNEMTGTTCRGTNCFFWSFFYLLFLTIGIIIFQCINYAMTVNMSSKD